MSALDDQFPPRLRQRLAAACPPFLLVAGPLEWLGRPGLGVVGSRDADDDALTAARESAALTVRHGWPVVSGLARGVDQVAMASALDAGGVVVGVPADGLLRASRNPEMRRRVHDGELCVVSPYAPDAPFRPGSAMGRNKLVYALSPVSSSSRPTTTPVGRGLARRSHWTADTHRWRSGPGQAPRPATTRSSVAARSR